MLDISVLDELNENDCMRILNNLAVKAYGIGSYIKIGYHMMSLIVNKTQFVILAFEKDKPVKTMKINGRLTFKNALKTLVSYVNENENAYISYLSHFPHMIDNTTSIEELLICNDLQVVG